MNTSRRVSSRTRAKAIGGAVIAAAVFSATFVVNRKMASAGGHWAWSAALRFLMMAPALLLVVAARGKVRAFTEAWRAAPGAWVLWGTVGSVVFYGCLTAAAAVAPAWVVAGTWPVAIVIGPLLAPLLYRDHRRRIPRRAVACSLLVLAGVAAIQLGQLRDLGGKAVATGLALVLASATAHPAGNRKSMLLMEEKNLPRDAYVRLLALIVGSLPGLAALCLWGYVESGPPPASQVLGCGIVAACGAIATPLFYACADRVGSDVHALAAVEATQAAEVVFTLAGEVLFLGLVFPGPAGVAGAGAVIAGILFHARATGDTGATAPRRIRPAPTPAGG